MDNRSTPSPSSDVTQYSHHSASTASGNSDFSSTFMTNIGITLPVQMARIISSSSTRILTSLDDSQEKKKRASTSKDAKAKRKKTDSKSSENSSSPQPSLVAHESPSAINTREANEEIRNGQHEALKNFKSIILKAHQQIEQLKTENAELKSDNFSQGNHIISLEKENSDLIMENLRLQAQLKGILAYSPESRQLFFGSVNLSPSHRATPPPPSMNISDVNEELVNSFLQ